MTLTLQLGLCQQFGLNNGHTCVEKDQTKGKNAKNVCMVVEMGRKLSYSLRSWMAMVPVLVLPP